MAKGDSLSNVSDVQTFSFLQSYANSTVCQSERQRERDRGLHRPNKRLSGNNI